MRVAVVLFTRDLRVHDNPALATACREAERVVPLFVLDEAILRSPFNRPNRAALLAACLADLDAALRERGGRLVVRRGDVVAETVRVARAVGAGAVHVAADVTPYAVRRARRLAADLPCELREHAGAVTAVAPGQVRPAGGSAYRVFTPYHRAWLGALHGRPVLDPPTRVLLPDGVSGGRRLPSAGQLCRGRPSPGLADGGGERAAREHARRWLRDHLATYAEHHDDLRPGATSRLSPWLHLGALSAYEVAAMVGRASAAPGPGAEAFLRQLAWRDFHAQCLADRPEAVRDDYRPRGAHWRTDDAALGAWRSGRTGYPLVDAAMRQLAEEGWLPNRARLVAAGFLAKTLRVDWRLGARHFADLLSDADVASNTMNWQWAAGTGADTRPGRVLNPVRQAERFDPSGDYVRRYVPELAGLSAREVVRPWRLPRPVAGYPPPVVDPGPGR